MDLMQVILSSHPGLSFRLECRLSCLSRGRKTSMGKSEVCWKSITTVYSTSDDTSREYLSCMGSH